MNLKKEENIKLNTVNTFRPENSEHVLLKKNAVWREALFPKGILLIYISLRENGLHFHPNFAEREFVENSGLIVKGSVFCMKSNDTAPQEEEMVNSLRGTCSCGASHTLLILVNK